MPLGFSGEAGCKVQVKNPRIQGSNKLGEAAFSVQGVVRVEV